MSRTGNIGKVSGISSAFSSKLMDILQKRGRSMSNVSVEVPGGLTARPENIVWIECGSFGRPEARILGLGRLFKSL